MRWSQCDLRRATATPNSPRPSSASVAGSGTALETRVHETLSMHEGRLPLHPYGMFVRLPVPTVHGPARRLVARSPNRTPSTPRVLLAPTPSRRVTPRELRAATRALRASVEAWVPAENRGEA